MRRDGTSIPKSMQDDMCGYAPGPRPEGEETDDGQAAPHARRRRRAVIDRATALAARAGDEVFYLRACFRAGLLRLDPPRTALQVVRAMARHGALGGAPAAAAARDPQRVAVAAERGALTYSGPGARTKPVAHGPIPPGGPAGDGAAALARH